MAMEKPLRIKKLPGQVVDQIAAGEVIERPAQLIKEIIENSLDAGATAIELSLSSSLGQIQVLDNGHGISEEDLPLVFERHSTSKITEADDLFELNSFGFRGEALSAIGAVSKVSIETKHQSEEQGSLYVWDTGEEVLKESLERDTGTKFSITQLFDNTPARKKFLKSQRYELSLVKKVFQAFALKHFDKSFKLVLDSKLVEFYDQAENLEKRYAQVHKGKKVYKISLPESEFLLKGSSLYLEEPGIESKTKSALWIFVQDRWIQDKTVAAAVREGLNTYLMHGCFPKGVVNLHLNPSFVDVNVHPMKSEIRYQDSSFIYKSLRHAVSEWAKLSPWNASVLGETVPYQTDPGKRIENGKSTFSTPRYFKEPSPSYKEVQAAIQVQAGFDMESLDKVQYKQSFGDLKSHVVETLVKTEDSFEPQWSSLMVLGQVNLTYIMAQSQDALFLVDQHAAHERIGYEKLLKSWKENKSDQVQNLLMPLSMDMEEVDVEALLSQVSELSKLGISIERGGPEVVYLNSLPGFLKEASVELALRKLARNTRETGGGTSLEEVFELFFATVSCHSVIRAGHAMSLDEMKLLFLEMDKYKSSYCPHGRPVYKKISFASLDKDFGRSL